MADPVDTRTPNSPGWWLERLNSKLLSRIAHMNLLDDYDTGIHPLPEGDERCREMFQRFQRKARTNYAGLVIESPLERMLVTGFRTGGDSSDDADKEAWRIWQANHLDADSDLVHRGQLVFGRSFVMVGPNPADAKTPLITPEDPRQCIVEVDPKDRRTIRAAAKIFDDDALGTTTALLMIGDAILTFAREKTGWVLLKDPELNPAGEPSIVQFLNRPRLNGSRKPEVIHETGVFEDCMSELAGVIDIQDRINDTILNRLVIAKVQAYRQRWAKGLKVFDENGNPVDLPFQPGVDLLWAVEDNDVEFGDFEITDVTPILRAVEADVRDMGAISRTPPHYLLGSIVNASGDALSAGETGLVSKVFQRERHAGENWEKVMELAGKLADYEPLQQADTETLWKDPTYRTQAEMADASVKFAAAGVPWRSRMRLLQMTPQEIDRMSAERAEDQLMAPPLPRASSSRPAPIVFQEPVSDGSAA